MTVRYRGSPYHKRYLSRWGSPALRSDKTECPVEVAEAEIVRVLECTSDTVGAIQASIDRGWCSTVRDGIWPRYVWGRNVFARTDGTSVHIVWEARVENRGVPEYKAYPVERDDHSDNMEPELEGELWPAS